MLPQFSSNSPWLLRFLIQLSCMAVLYEAGRTLLGLWHAITPTVSFLHAATGVTGTDALPFVQAPVASPGDSPNLGSLEHWYGDGSGKDSKTAITSASAPASAAATEGVESGQGGWWYSPQRSQVNDLHDAVHGSGTYGFVYDSSQTPSEKYGVYNWCNMPHVRAAEYVRPGREYDLAYVEVVS